MSEYDRCIAYLSKMNPAVSGSGGSNQTLLAACRVLGFTLLTESEQLDAMLWWNEHKCQPRWTQKEIMHKLESARSRTVRPMNTQPPPRPQYNQPVKPITAAELLAITARRNKTMPKKTTTPATYSDMVDAMNTAVLQNQHPPNLGALAKSVALAAIREGVAYNETTPADERTAEWRQWATNYGADWTVQAELV